MLPLVITVSYSDHSDHTDDSVRSVELHYQVIPFERRGRVDDEKEPGFRSLTRAVIFFLHYLKQTFTAPDGTVRGDTDNTGFQE